MHIVMYTDGGTSGGNPGFGYGSYCFMLEGYPPIYGKGNFGLNCTSNEAEYKALLLGLARVKEYSTEIELEIRLDSALLVGQLQRDWKVKASNLELLWSRAMYRLNEFDAWRIVKVPREEIEIVLGH